jgi:hypothetical protein
MLYQLQSRSPFAPQADDLPKQGRAPTILYALAGYEVMAMVKKGQVRGTGGRDMRAQASFIAELFQGTT